MKNRIYMLSPVKGVQMGSYIITSDDGHLVMIDGGWRTDAEDLLKHLRLASGSDKPCTGLSSAMAFTPANAHAPTNTERQEIARIKLFLFFFINL